MDALLHWILAGAAGLFFIGVIVAWWEHLGRENEKRQAALPAPASRAVAIDVDVDALAAAPPLDQPADGDVGKRRQTLDGALVRMAQRQGEGDTVSRRTWVDTAPMVGKGLSPDTSPSDAEPTESPSTTLS